MILSILIPVYNYCCVSLVKELHAQAENCGLEYEILVADDGSTDPSSIARNSVIDTFPHSRFLCIGENHGRAWIRNWLAGHAQGESLLFIDSDARVCSQNFLSAYRPYMGGSSVVCGGIVHPDRLPSPHVSLRYENEKAKKPRISARERSRHPCAKLRTFNFMMPRRVALSHPFDPSITLYGYEDTLLGSRLQAAGIPVIHIDNPLVNADIEDNARFLAKTEESMHSLHGLRTQMEGHSRLLSHYALLERLCLVRPARWVFSLLRTRLRRQLTGPNPSVHLFHLYKIGFYCTLN